MQVDLEIAGSSLPHSLRHTFFAPQEDTYTPWTLDFVHKVRLLRRRLLTGVADVLFQLQRSQLWWELED